MSIWLNSPAVIQAHGLTRRYGERLAVNKLDLCLRQGEVLGLLGRNGAGKSSILNMLTGNLAPSAGSIRIGEIDLLQHPKSAKKNIGYLPEHPPLHLECSVREFLTYAAALHGVAKNKQASAVDDVIQLCELQSVYNRLIGNLSKGFQQRVGIAQAIVHAPPIIILDEPTVGLDPQQILSIRALITTLAKNHSLILSSHILADIQAACTRVMIIHHGQTVYDQAIHHAAQNQIFVQLKNPPPTLQISSAAKITPLHNGSYLIDVPQNIDLRTHIAELAVSNNWGLLELKLQIFNLEETFMRRTVDGTFQSPHYSQ